MYTGSVKRSKSPYTYAKSKRDTSAKRSTVGYLSKSPAKSTLEIEELQKYPLYHRLKLAKLGLRPKRLPLSSVQKLIDAIFGSMPLNMSCVNSHVLKYFKQLNEPRTKSVKMLENTILDFVFSLECYKRDCLLCLMFGKMLSEIYAIQAVLFGASIRAIIEEECNWKLAYLAVKKNGLDNVRIPFTKLRTIAHRFVVKGGLDQSSDLFIQNLLERYPNVKLIFTPGSKRIQHLLHRIPNLHSRFIRQKHRPAENPPIFKRPGGVHKFLQELQRERDHQPDHRRGHLQSERRLLFESDLLHREIRRTHHRSYQRLQIFSH